MNNEFIQINKFNTDAFVFIISRPDTSHYKTL